VIVGNREELLAGARKCLIEKGYVQTTARDIANVSGVSLAAIGYHFGTKDALLQEAMVQANVEWGEQVDRAVAETTVTECDDWETRVQTVWERLLSASPEDLRMLQASMEVLLNVEQATPVCSSINSAMFRARNALLTMFDHDTEALTGAERDSAGRVYHALLVGARLLQLVNPEVAPSAQDITSTLDLVSRRMNTEHAVHKP
jgi:AcrR family transcriptional regulator